MSEPQTEAGRGLLGNASRDQCVPPCVSLGSNDPEAAVLAIETQAVALDRAALVAAVDGLPRTYGTYAISEFRAAVLGLLNTLPAAPTIDSAALDVQRLTAALRATGALWSQNDYYEATSDADEFAAAIAAEYDALLHRGETV